MDKAALMAADMVGGICVGDEVQLDVRDDNQPRGSFGISHRFHDAWGTVIDIRPAHPDDASWGAHHHYYVQCGEHPYNWSVPLSCIKDWRPKKRDKS